VPFTGSPSTVASPSPPEGPSVRIFGTGEMADLVRAFDWSATSLGPIETWPEPLLTTVNLLLGSRHPLFLWWGEDLIQFYNDAYRPSLGRGKHPAALGQRGQDCWREVWQTIGPKLCSVLDGGESTWNVDQYLPIYRNGDQLEDAWWTFGYSPVRDTSGHIGGVFVVVSETTSRVLAERELNRNRERLQLALEAADLGTWSYNPQDQTFTADAAMQRLFGAPEPTGDHDFWQQRLHPDDRRMAREAFDAALAGLRPYNLEYRVLHPDGVRWIRSKGNALAAEGGARGMFAIVEDITENKLAEMELRSSTRDLRESQRIGRMGSWRLILATGELTWSEEVYRLMEHDPSLPVLNYAERPELIDPDSNRRLQAAVDHCIATGQAYELDVKMYLPGSGKTVWLATRGEAVLDAEGKVLELRGTVRDITDRKLAEEALIRSEKLAAVGRLASSIAHEINNPLESITNLLYLARFAEDLDQSREYLALADAELRRVSAITSQTLRFHRQATRPTEVTCEDLMSTALDILRSRILNANVKVEKRKRATRPVLCFEGEIRQVVSNLIVNAIDAMHPTGGRLLLRSRTGQDHATGRAGLVITIADTGTGMPSDTLTKIFEPFYTTKGIAGTGLGLWISKEILDRHQGHLRVRSSQRRGRSGTVITLFLPFEAVAR
jgi:PAS domain S-box-containing protein